MTRRVTAEYPGMFARREGYKVFHESPVWGFVRPADGGGEVGFVSYETAAAAADADARRAHVL